jgi:hypothetical protein
MQQVLLYDRTRVPPNWIELVRPGQYAVFLSDVESSAPLSIDGTPVSSASEYFCLLCDSLAEAEDYCREAVIKIRRLKCEVFDSAGRANAPVATLVNEEFAHTLDTEARDLSSMSGITTPRVPLDKSEGGVKDKNILSVFLAPFFLPERLRTKTLEISR